MKSQTTLLQRLRKTRSTGKTLIIERWSEIRDALAAGFEKKDVYQELQSEGLSIGYTQFTRFTKELLDQEKEEGPQKKPPLTKEISRDQEPVIPAEGSKANQSEKSGRRFNYNPNPDEAELI
ncbi:MAG: hypothetical protein ABW168_05720 [Sedimenticola sp.]